MDNGDGSWSLLRNDGRFDGKYLSVREYREEVWTQLETKDRARFWLEPSIDALGTPIACEWRIIQLYSDESLSTGSPATETTTMLSESYQSTTSSSETTTQPTSTESQPSSTESTTESTTTVTTTTTTAAPQTQKEMKSCTLLYFNGLPTLWPNQHFRCPMNHDCTSPYVLLDIFHHGCERA